MVLRYLLGTTLVLSATSIAISLSHTSLIQTNYPRGFAYNARLSLSQSDLSATDSWLFGWFTSPFKWALGNSAAILNSLYTLGGAIILLLTFNAVSSGFTRSVRKQLTRVRNDLDTRSMVPTKLKNLPKRS